VRPSAEPAFPRRIFLKRSLQAAGALIVLPRFVAGCSAAPRGEVPAGLKTFSADEYLIAAAVADTLIPDGGAFEAGARSLGLAKRLDEFLVGESQKVVKGTLAALWTLEYGGILLAGQFGRFSSMSPERRIRYFEKLPLGFETGRAIFLGLKRAFVFLFYNMDGSWPAVGYDGPWVNTGQERPPA
jgi:hypothetical protein